MIRTVLRGLTDLADYKGASRKYRVCRKLEQFFWDLHMRYIEFKHGEQSKAAWMSHLDIVPKRLRGNKKGYGISSNNSNKQATEA